MYAMNNLKSSSTIVAHIQLQVKKLITTSQHELNQIENRKKIGIWRWRWWRNIWCRILNFFKRPFNHSGLALAPLWTSWVSDELADSAILPAVTQLTPQYPLSQTKPSLRPRRVLKLPMKILVWKTPAREWNLSPKLFCLQIKIVHFHNVDRAR